VESEHNEVDGMKKGAEGTVLAIVLQNAMTND